MENSIRLNVYVYEIANTISGFKCKSNSLIMKIKTIILVTSAFYTFCMAYLLIEKYMADLIDHISAQQNISITFVQRRPKVFDVDPTLSKCHTNVFVFAGWYMPTVELGLYSKLIKIKIARTSVFKIPNWLKPEALPLVL